MKITSQLEWTESQVELCCGLDADGGGSAARPSSAAGVKCMMEGCRTMIAPDTDVCDVCRRKQQQAYQGTVPDCQLAPCTLFSVTAIFVSYAVQPSVGLK